jgi:glycosyltransferase involved in cell wall biosynthesis
VIAGNDESGFGSELRALAARLGVEARIRFVGPAYDERKRELMARAAALVVPSFFESFGNVVVEAMAVGCPVVVTPQVGAADLVRESGAGLVVEGDSESLAAGIKGLLDDPVRHQDMRKAGPATASGFCTWDAIARQMEGVYREILAPADRSVARRGT